MMSFCQKSKKRDKKNSNIIKTIGAITDSKQVEIIKYILIILMKIITFLALTVKLWNNFLFQNQH